MTASLDGKVAIITGAARGIGRATAVRLATDGAAIIALDLPPSPGDGNDNDGIDEDLRTTAKRVEAAGGRVVVGSADVRDFDQLVKAAAAGVAELGRIDIVVVNAGVTRVGSALDVTEEDWRFVLDVNLTGAWLTCKAAVPHVLAGGAGGSVVLVSSIYGLKANAMNAPYVASKHGLVGLMRSLAVELASENVRVNAVHPTFVDTPLLRSVIPAGTPFDDVSKGVEQRHALPVGTIEPDDVAHAIAYLASDHARYVTGVSLPVDAGALVK